MFIYMLVFSPWQSMSETTLFIWLDENIANLVKISNIRNVLTLKKNIILLIGLSFAEYLLNLTVGL